LTPCPSTTLFRSIGGRRGDDRRDAGAELDAEAEAVDPAAIAEQPPLVHLAQVRREPPAGKQVDGEPHHGRRCEREQPLGRVEGKSRSHRAEYGAEGHALSRGAKQERRRRGSESLSTTPLTERSDARE